MCTADNAGNDNDAAEDAGDTDAAWTSLVLAKLLLLSLCSSGTNLESPSAPAPSSPSSTSGLAAPCATAGFRRDISSAAIRKPAMELPNK